MYLKIKRVKEFKSRQIEYILQEDKKAIGFYSLANITQEEKEALKSLNTKEKARFLYKKFIELYKQKRKRKRKDEVKAIHLIFSSEEMINETSENKVYDFVVDFLKKANLKENYSFIGAIHNDTIHYNAHIYLMPYNLQTGKKLDMGAVGNIIKLRKIANETANEHGLKTTMRRRIGVRFSWAGYKETMEKRKIAVDYLKRGLVWTASSMLKEIEDRTYQRAYSYKQEENQIGRGIFQKVVKNFDIDGLEEMENTIYKREFLNWENDELLKNYDEDRKGFKRK